MEKYKGFYIPKGIKKEYLSLDKIHKESHFGCMYEPTISGTGWVEGKGYPTHDVCSNVAECDKCILCTKRCSFTIEYLVENNYMSKEQALQFTLDNQ